MATYKPVGFTQAYTHQLALRRQVLVEEKNDEHLYRFQIRAAEGKSRLSPEMPIKKIFQKLQSILAHEKRHHTLCIVPQKLHESGMELQYEGALTEENKDCYVYYIVRIVAIDEVNFMVNFVPLINLSFLRTGYGPQYRRICTECVCPSHG